jgi:hypothetical protein
MEMDILLFFTKDRKEQPDPTNGGKRPERKKYANFP